MGDKKKGFFSRLVEGLTKTRDSIVGGIDSVFSGFSAIDDDFYEEIEETLIMGDMGIQTTMAVIEDLKKTVKEQHIKEPEKCREALIASIRAKMDLGENAYEFENRKSVVLVIGVNGVGKTTSIGKLADQLKTEGKKVVLAAADTCSHRPACRVGEPRGRGADRPERGIRSGCRDLRRDLRDKIEKRRRPDLRYRGKTP